MPSDSIAEDLLKKKAVNLAAAIATSARIAVSTALRDVPLEISACKDNLRILDSQGSSVIAGGCRSTVTASGISLRAHLGVGTVAARSRAAPAATIAKATRIHSTSLTADSTSWVGTPSVFPPVPVRD